MTRYARAALGAALGCAAVLGMGMGAGIAQAAPVAPNACSAQHPEWCDHDHDHDHRGHHHRRHDPCADWRGPDYWFRNCDTEDHGWDTGFDATQVR